MTRRLMSEIISDGFPAQPPEFAAALDDLRRVMDRARMHPEMRTNVIASILTGDLDQLRELCSTLKRRRTV